MAGKKSVDLFATYFTELRIIDNSDVQRKNRQRILLGQATVIYYQSLARKEKNTNDCENGFFEQDNLKKAWLSKFVHHFDQIPKGIC